jgi:hypothetical protein
VVRDIQDTLGSAKSTSTKRSIGHVVSDCMSVMVIHSVSCHMKRWWVMVVVVRTWSRRERHSRIYMILFHHFVLVFLWFWLLSTSRLLRMEDTAEERVGVVDGQK